MRRPGGCFTHSVGPSDEATDHCPLLFVHSRMVRHQSNGPSLLVEYPPEASKIYLWPKLQAEKNEHFFQKVPWGNRSQIKNTSPGGMNWFTLTGLKVSGWPWKVLADKSSALCRSVSEPVLSPPGTAQPHPRGTRPFGGAWRTRGSAGGWTSLESSSSGCSVRPGLRGLLSQIVIKHIHIVNIASSHAWPGAHFTTTVWARIQHISS